MATSKDLEAHVRAVFRQYFDGQVYRIDMHDHLETMSTAVRVTYRHAGQQHHVQHLLDIGQVARRDEARYLDMIAQDMAQQMYLHLLKADPEFNSRLSPDPYDPDAQAIWALVSLVGGEFIARQTPTLEAGKENPWMLNLPVQGKIIPVPKPYFMKPLDWWQRFISYNTGLSV